MTFITNNHLNKHGFFEVGEARFYSKLDAILYSLEVNLPVEWNFNNEVFSQLDWTVEPVESIRELYLRRAQDIRDHYDYVVVMFSGGADSTTVLDSFINNGIHVDEIYMQHWGQGQGGLDQHMTSEIFRAALPYIERKLPADSGTLITVNDISDHLLACLKDPVMRQRSYRECNNIHNLSQIHVHHDLQNRFERWRDVRAQGKKLCFVWGESKPHIDYDMEKQKHYFYFEDHYAHAPQPRDQENPDPLVHHEQFYDDPTHPELKIKQCHLMLKTLAQIKNRSDIFVDFDPDTKKALLGPRGFDIRTARATLATTWSRGKKWWLDRNAFNCSIYPDWNFLTYHEDKQAGRLIHPAHEWLQEQAPQDAKAWFTGYIKAYSGLGDAWINHRGGLKQGIKRLQIKYFLE